MSVDMQNWEDNYWVIDKNKYGKFRITLGGICFHADTEEEALRLLDQKLQVMSQSVKRISKAKGIKLFQLPHQPPKVPGDNPKG